MPYDTFANDTVQQLVVGRFQNLWGATVDFIPSLVLALVLFVLGLIIASILAKVVEKILDTLTLDSVLKQVGLEKYFHRAGVRLHASRFLGQLVFWFITIAFLLMSSDILGLSQLSVYLTSVLNYFPNIVVAVLIMLASVVLANVIRRVVNAAVKGAQMPASQFLGTLVWWAVAMFGLFGALLQLNVATAIINSLVTGFIAMLALAGGLAFGLGGKDYAAHLVGKLRDHTESD